MKKSLVSLFILCACFSAHAQDTLSFKKGIINFSVGAGLPSIDMALYDASSARATGPFHGKILWAVSGKYEIGASFNYCFAEVDVKNSLRTYRRTNEYISYLLRVNRHFSVDRKLDPYFGIGLGYRMQKSTFTENGDTTHTLNPDIESPFAMEITVGMRYYFNRYIGLYTEVGFAKSMMQAGLSVKL